MLHFGPLRHAQESNWWMFQNILLDASSNTFPTTTQSNLHILCLDRNSFSLSSMCQLWHSPFKAKWPSF